MKNNLLFFIILLFCTIACENQEKYFNGNISIIESFENEGAIKGELVKLNGIEAGFMRVYDSLLIFGYRSPEYYLHIFNLNTKEMIGEFCPIGHGPEEFNGYTDAEQFIIENGDIKLWISDDNQKQLLFNITRSLNEHKTCFDSLIRLQALKVSAYSFYYTFMLDKKRFLARTQCQKQYLQGAEYIPGNYTIYKGDVSNIEKKFTIYNKPILNSDDIDPTTFYNSRDRIKPDKSKVAMAMRHVAQINLLDIKSGHLQGFRINNTPDFDYLTKNYRDFITYYMGLYADNQYLYAQYIGKNIREEKTELSSTTLHVFDWEGKPKYKLKLTPSFFKFSIDPVNKILYGKNRMEEVYRYDLNKVILFN